MAKLRELLIDVRTNTAKFSQGMERVEQRLQKTSKIARSAAGALAGAFAVGGIVNATRQAIDHADAIAKDARNVGLLSEEFQALSFAARRSGVQQSAFNSSMTAFVKRVGEAKEGLGPLAGFLRKYDAELLKSVQSSKDQKEALDVVFAAINRAKSETEKAAIANAAFSRSGLRMKLMAADYQQLTEEAKKLGYVLSNETVASAEVASDAMENMTSRTEKQFTEMWLTLAPLTIKINDGISSIGRSVGNLYNTISSGDQFTPIKVLQQKIGELHASVLEDEERLSSASGRNARNISTRIAKQKSEIGRLQDIIATQQGKGQKSEPLPGAEESVNTVSAAVERLNSLVGGKSVEQWDKLKTAITDVKSEFESLLDIDAGPLDDYGKLNASIEARQLSGSANQALRAGRSEDALKFAREAKDLLEKIKEDGGTIDRELAAAITETAISAAGKIETLAKAAVSFDEKATNENAEALLKNIESKMSGRQIVAPIKMDLINGVPSFSAATQSAEDLTGKLGVIGSSLEKINGTTIDIKFADPERQAQAMQQAVKSAADSLEVVAKGKIEFDGASAKEGARKIIDEVTQEAASRPVVIPVKFSRQTGSGIDEQLTEHVFKAGGS